MNSLPTDAQNVIIDFANKGKAEAALIDRSNLFIKKQSNGDIDVYQVANTDENGKQDIQIDEKYKIGTLPKVGTNLKVQPNAKSKVAVVAEGENKPIVHTGYTKADLKAGGWTDDQINKAVIAGKIKLN
jgi:hypothetical protein